VKIAFVGKGGAGKTTLTALLARHLAAQGRPLLAIDADINQHLGVALGVDERQAAALPAMGAHLDQIKQYLRGDNPRIRSTAAMVKTTPPGAGRACCGWPSPTRSPSGWSGASPGYGCWSPARSTRTTWVWPATTPRWVRSSCGSTT